MVTESSESIRTNFPLINWIRRWFPVDQSKGIFCSSMSLNNENQTKLFKCSTESETKSFIDRSGTIRQIRQSTERSVLAQRNIFLRKKLGEGSFSSVREGFDLFHQRKVAIKIIDTQRASKDFQEKFLPRELNIWPRVQHENIIRMYENFIESGKIFMILEFAAQGDLLTYVQRVGAIPEEKRNIWSFELCDAVKYLHDIEIVHRDLKLENLLLDHNEKLKLCDFGFSKDLVKSKDFLSQTYCGSRAYVSPEILLGLPYDAKKADVWAIGVILYIFLTGVMPFKEDKNNQLILKQHEKLDLHWPKEKETGESARDLILKMFVYDWQRRLTIEQVHNHPWLSRRTTVKTLTNNRAEKSSVVKRKRNVK